ncbi:hypothetical protein EFP84_01565 [Leptospira kmetyi]|uniref:Uncharacterized protein n=1 Tax=Leptospira kmetyi TaxID=408139 RepID=A0A5F1Y0Q5_9LEPT|nr:hypothetical protein EFP84_01565 [Leptospira kmetyi]TGK22685.1 hypothetical protein EHO62_02395 [Leptospira kmetyi]TGK27519.1 hypothetical protein EHO66_15885 [Leptospira kmetyi]TGL64862.1 hypothetical protein EHQ67_19365 [Leptospira kmetyi]
MRRKDSDSIPANELALKDNRKAKDLGDFRSGFILIYKVLESSLKNELIMTNTFILKQFQQ